MPTYVYRCKACGLIFERPQRMTDLPLTACPKCLGRVRRVFQPVPVLFRGPGFYVTDNKTSGPSTGVPDDGTKLRDEDKGEKEQPETEAGPSD